MIAARDPFKHFTLTLHLISVLRFRISGFQVGKERFFILYNDFPVFRAWGEHRILIKKSM